MADPTMAVLRIKSVIWLLLAGGSVIALFALGAQSLAVGLFPAPWDKLAHGVAFGGLFLILDQALAWPRLTIVCLPLFVSALDEWHQMSLPGRHAGIDDWLAGLAGVFLMFCLTYYLGNRRQNPC